MRAPRGAQVMDMDSQSETESKVGKGFTLVEMLVTLVLFSVVMASAIGLLMSQRSLYDVQADRIDLQRNVRAAIDVVAGELRSIPAGGVVGGWEDSVKVRLPIRWGLACGHLNKAAPSKDPNDPPPAPGPDAEIYIPIEVDPLFAPQPQSGVGFRDTDGTWTFVEGTSQPWGTEALIETFVFCTGGPDAKVRKDKFDKEGDLVERGDTAFDADYARFMGFYAYVGFEAYQGAQIIVYTNVTYRFGPSEFDPGSRGLFRDTSEGPQELAGLFDDDSGFEYIMNNGNPRSNLNNLNQTERVVGIRINAFATKINQAGGASRTLDYDATIDVLLRNFGDE